MFTPKRLCRRHIIIVQAAWLFNLKLINFYKLNFLCLITNWRLLPSFFAHGKRFLFISLYCLFLSSFFTPGEWVLIVSIYLFDQRIFFYLHSSSFFARECSQILFIIWSLWWLLYLRFFFKPGKRSKIVEVFVKIVIEIWRYTLVSQTFNNPLKSYFSMVKKVS